jgi:hypothetical protein
MGKALLHKELLQLHQSVDCPPRLLFKRDDNNNLVFERKVGEECSDITVALVNIHEDKTAGIEVSWKDLGLEERVVLRAMIYGMELNLAILLERFNKLALLAEGLR